MHCSRPGTQAVIFEPPSALNYTSVTEVLPTFRTRHWPRSSPRSRPRSRPRPRPGPATGSRPQRSANHDRNALQFGVVDPSGLGMTDRLAVVTLHASLSTPQTSKPRVRALRIHALCILLFTKPACTRAHVSARKGSCVPRGLPPPPPPRLPAWPAPYRGGPCR